MAATDHPIVLDLGQVRGLVVTNGKPSDSDGAEGELRIDPSNGNVWKRTGGAWILLCQFALASSIAPLRSTETQLPILSGSTGTYDGAHQVNIFGGIGFLNISSDNRDESVWKMPINIGSGSSESTTKIFRLPEGIRPSKADYVMGRLVTSSRVYRAEFTVASAYGDYPGYVSINAVLDDDFTRIRDGSDNIVTQFTATGFNLSCAYRVAGF